MRTLSSGTSMCVLLSCIEASYSALCSLSSFSANVASAQAAPASAREKGVLMFNELWDILDEHEAWDLVHTDPKVVFL